MVKPISPVLKWLVVIQTSILIFLVILFVYLSFFRSTPATMVTTYSECAALPDSRIQESYPATCVTKAGQRFIQPVPEAIE